ncbi:MAG TPA: hypothetical protein VF449_07180, partial [Parvibaculum sp.]
KAAPGQELTFSDVLDTLNPLQHIPVVSDIYRHLTGDTISPAARVAGDTLYGGPIGLVMSVANAAIDAVSGKDLGEHAFASLFGDDKPAAATVTANTSPVETTGSIAAASAAPKQIVADARPKAAGQTKPVPQLSPEAFSALMNSFSNPDAAKAANPSLASAAAQMPAKAPAAKPAIASAMPTAKFTRAVPAGKAAPIPSDQAVALATAAGGTKPSKDLMSAMQSALDQYDAMKSTNPALPATSLNMSGEGF